MSQRPIHADKGRDPVPSHDQQNNKLLPGEHLFQAPNGLSFRYLVCSSSANGQCVNPLVLVQGPGWGLGFQYLQAGLSPLEDMFTLVYFQPRGSSGSSRPSDPGKMSCFDMASDLDLFRSYLGMAKFPRMVGHSHGGTIVVAYAEMFPHCVEKILLIDHRLYGYTDLEFFRSARRNRINDPRYQQAYQVYDSVVPTDDASLTSFFIDILPLYFFDPEKYLPGFLEQLSLDPNLSNQNPNSQTAIDFWCYSHVKRCDLELDVHERMIRSLGSVVAETMIIFGKDDAQCSVAISGETCQRIPHAESIVLPDCGHFPWVESCDETLSTMRTFLRR
ncbi:hypothetical protein FQN57_005930 [Myotisia sp. PD_48]|nr:hypothetical protein FQN57_005930 [Myotisia sp. PD_48]